MDHRARGRRDGDPFTRARRRSARLVRPRRHGQFFGGWGRRAGHAELPGLAAAQAERTGWAKLIGGWGFGEEPIPAGSAAAVEAKADSLEHGMCLDPALLPQLAAQGTALTPRLYGIVEDPPKAASASEGPRKDGYVGGASVHAELTAAAAEAGVTLLAGTDSRPHGRVADEIRALAAAGVRPHDGLAAGSWAARSDLGQLDHPRAIILRGQLVATITTAR